MWSEQVTKVELSLRLVGPGPALRLSDGGSAGSQACGSKAMSEASITYVAASRELAWHWTCSPAIDAGAGAATSADGKRTLSTSEGASLVDALRAVELHDGSVGCDGASVWATTWVGSSAASYYDLRDGTCGLPASARTVTNLAEAFDRAVALALVP